MFRPSERKRESEKISLMFAVYSLIFFAFSFVPLSLGVNRPLVFVAFWVNKPCVETGRVVLVSNETNTDVRMYT